MEIKRKSFEQSVKTENVLVEKGKLVWSFDTEKACLEQFKQLQENREFPREKHSVKYWFRDKFVKYLKPDNLKYVPGQGKYCLYSPYGTMIDFKVRKGIFYKLCLVGWIHKLIEEIV